MARQSIYCEECGRNKLHEREDVNHVLHLLLSLVCAFWFPVWLIVYSWNEWFDPWLCQECGHGVPSNKTTFFVLIGILATVVLAVFCCVGLMFAIGSS